MPRPKKQAKVSEEGVVLSSAPTDGDGCHNCKWAVKHGTSPQLRICDVDLPPMLNVNPDWRRRLVNSNYLCGFHWRIN